MGAPLLKNRVGLLLKPIGVMVSPSSRFTSNKASLRRLGGKTWARLHKLVYAIIALGALHFVMVVKSWPIEPLVYAAVVAVLLGYRLIRAGACKSRRTQA
jgi:DMSO/TMAO reductase YedYZ heme-binding membrane subunit